MSALVKDKATLTEQLGKTKSNNQAQVIKIEHLIAEIATLKTNSNKAETGEATTAKIKPKARSRAFKADNQNQQQNRAVIFLLSLSTKTPPNGGVSKTQYIAS